MRLGYGRHPRQVLEWWPSPIWWPALPSAGLVVAVHGGAWNSGDPIMPGSNLDFYIQRAQRAGYAVASIGYRYSTDAPWPAQADDVVAALAWLAASPRLDFERGRVALLGESAGGQIAAVAAMRARVRGVVALYGPGNLGRLDADAPAYGWATARSPLIPLLGGLPGQVADATMRDASPERRVTESGDRVARTFLVHGTADPVVGVAQSRRFAAALTNTGQAATLLEVAGGEHGGDAFRAPAVDTAVALELAAMLA